MANWLLVLGLLTYFAIGLMLASSIKANPTETIVLLIAWPFYVVTVLLILFGYLNFQLGILVTSRVQRRRRYLKRRNAKKQNEEVL